MSDHSDRLLSQQTALAQFGEFALKSDDLDEVLQEACRLVSEAMGTPLIKVMELDPDGQSLLVRAGVGWRPGIVGEMRVSIGQRTAERQAIQTGEAVISPDIRTEERFDYPAFIRENGVHALTTVVIVGGDSKKPFGVLEVDSPVPREFSDADTLFLRGYANLLAAAVERLQITAELRKKADEKERLLRELQHRIKNNLATVMGLVRRAVRKARQAETADALRAVGDGIEALRMVHEKIYRAADGLDYTCLGTYLADLAASLLAFHGRAVVTKIRLVSDIQNINVPAEIAIPFGLIASEFITNSLNYAFGGGRGRIGLQVEETEGNELLVVFWDDGAGLPAEPTRGTGMSLINGLARQVGGTSQWSGEGGTRLTIRLSKPAIPSS